MELPSKLVALLERLQNQGLRQWYATCSGRHGWFLAVLEHLIAWILHAREGSAPNNLEHGCRVRDLAWPAKNSLVLDTLGLSAGADEAAMEDAMSFSMAQTLWSSGLASHSLWDWFLCTKPHRFSSK
jgi:predicted nuclease of restriction endonuclease-like (RecB) superfamily